MSIFVDTRALVTKARTQGVESNFLSIVKQDAERTSVIGQPDIISPEPCSIVNVISSQGSLWARDPLYCNASLSDVVFWKFEHLEV